MDRAIVSIIALQAALAGLKLANVVAWNWWLILMPVAILAAIAIIGGLIAGIDAREDRARRHF